MLVKNNPTTEIEALQLIEEKFTQFNGSFRIVTTSLKGSEMMKEARKHFQSTYPILWAQIHPSKRARFGHFELYRGYLPQGNNLQPFIFTVFDFDYTK
jgi:hypothetical protein